jgi:hypothetical protein
MTAAGLVDLMSHLGVRLSAAEGRLRVDAPAGVLTEELRAALVEHKPAILAILAGPPAEPDPEAPASEFGRWLSALVAYHEATGRLKPLRPWPPGPSRDGEGGPPGVEAVDAIEDRETEAVGGIPAAP